MQSLLLLLWLLCIPGVITGIVLLASSEKTRKGGLITLLISVVLMLIIPSVCSGLNYLSIY